MDTVEDIYPLGSDPVLTPPSTSGNPQPHAEACPVCDGLPYKVAPEAIKGWLRLPPNKKFEVLFGVNPMRPEAAGRIVVHPASGRPEMYFAGDWTPPDHHLAWDWVQSSAAGCDTCDLVVKALQHASPGFWADVTPTTTYKRIWAQAVPGICVMATTTDTRQRFLTNRHQMFEIAAVSRKSYSRVGVTHQR
jgi:hypothetical protein